MIYKVNNVDYVHGERIRASLLRHLNLQTLFAYSLITGNIVFHRFDRIMGALCFTALRTGTYLYQSQEWLNKVISVVMQVYTHQIVP